MRAGKLIREKRADEAAAAKLCSCGHPMSEHRERGYETVVEYEDGVVVVIEKPRQGHVPGRFFCRASGCDCFRGSS